MRSVLVCALLAAATPAYADAMAVSKKVSKLETTDKTVTKVDVLVAVPNINACFTAPAEIDVDLKVGAGKVSVTIDRSNKELATCLETTFGKMKAKGTYTARIHLAAKPDPRKQAEKTDAILRSLDTIDPGPAVASLGSGTATGTGNGATGDFKAGGGAPSTNRVSVGGPDGEMGGYSADEIQKVIKARSGALRACYEMQLQKDPKLSGKFTYEIQIDKTGAVARVKLKSSTAKSPKLDDCLKRQLTKLKFSAKGSTATVTYPFIFQQQ